MLGSLVYDLLIILAAGLVAGLICRQLRVSVLIGYLLVGVILGNGGLAWIRDDQHEIEYLAEAGVFLLLFSIGLEFSLDELWRLGRHLVIGGTAQMLLVVLPIAGVLLGYGYSWQAAALIAAAASFSSTVLVFKSLSEFGHSSQPHGRRAIGILLYQDAALIPLLLLIPMLTGTGNAAGPLDYVRLAISSILFVVSIVGLRRLIAKSIIPRFAAYRSPDLVVLFTLVSIGGITLAAHRFGLPAAIGAFAAGLVFSGNRWTQQIDALILPFRETFAAIFFVSLGLLVAPQLVWEEPIWLLKSLIGLIVIKTTAAYVALRLTGLKHQTALGMSIGLAHVGEFAFVLVLLGREVGVIEHHDYQRIVILAIGSLILTPILLKLGLRRTQQSDETTDDALAWKRIGGGQLAIVVGAGPVGRQVASQLEIAGKDVCLIDLSQINLQPFAQQGFRTVAGDASEISTLELALANDAFFAAICVPEDESAIRIVRQIRKLNPHCYVLVRCRYQVNSATLLKLGANTVVSEEVEASSALLNTLTNLKIQPPDQVDC